jgi:hypothetical protein
VHRTEPLYFFLRRGAAMVKKSPNRWYRWRVKAAHRLRWLRRATGLYLRAMRRWLIDVVPPAYTLIKITEAIRDFIVWFFGG